MDGVTLKSEELVASAIPLGWKIAGRGDLDANGTLDLVWRDDETGDVAVWLLKGADVIRAPVISSGVPLAWRIVGVGDVNGDGKADLIWHDEQTGDVAVCRRPPQLANRGRGGPGRRRQSRSGLAIHQPAVSIYSTRSETASGSDHDLADEWRDRHPVGPPSSQWTSA